MRMNKAGLTIIKRFEGLYQKAYLCPAGVWTVGYGATGSDIGPGTYWTLQTCERDLSRRLELLEKNVLNELKTPLNDNQLSAIISLVYNIGIGAFKSSTLLKLINKGDLLGTSEQFERWNKVNGKVLKGLVRRRAAEKELFNTK